MSVYYSDLPKPWDVLLTIRLDDDAELQGVDVNCYAETSLLMEVEVFRAVSFAKAMSDRCLTTGFQVERVLQAIKDQPQFGCERLVLMAVLNAQSNARANTLRKLIWKAA